MFKKGIIPSDDAVKYGFIDGLANMDDVLSIFLNKTIDDRFAGIKIH